MSCWLPDIIRHRQGHCSLLSARAGITRAYHTVIASSSWCKGRQHGTLAAGGRSVDGTPPRILL